MKHTILGCGPVGCSVMTALAGRGEQVQVVSRQPSPRLVPGVTYEALDVPHTWAFTLDAGESLARVGLSADAFGNVWHVPSDRPRSQNEVAQELSTLLKRSVTIKPTPAWLLRIVGLFQPEAGGMVEMAYEFEQPFVVADFAARRLLGQSNTPFRDALEATVRWFTASSAKPAHVTAERVSN